MKTFKDMRTFEKCLQKTTCWEDEIKIGGRIFRIYEYGGGSLMHMDYDYVYFLNRGNKKRQNTLIYIKYHCPSSGYVKGKRIITGEYRFLGMEILRDAHLWR